MGWRLLDRPKTQKVTKSLAKSFAEMDPAPHDRPFSERRLMVYEKLLASGQFRPVTWATALCTETGGVYRVNGKHTSIMLSGMEKLPEFYVTIEEYECDTLEDVARLYSTFDSSMQSRTARDIYMSFASTIKELSGVMDKVIQTSITGIAYHHFGQDVYGKTQPAERAELLLEYPEFVIWLQNFIIAGPSARDTGLTGNQKCKHILRQPVAAAMFASWMKAKGPATEFWSAVRDESGNSAGLPDRKLARYLVTTGMSNSQGTKGKLKQASTREIYVKCLHAWNAWRRGETTNLNYYSDAKTPSVV